MSKKTTRRPSPALLVAMVALVAALAGTATALPGKNTVDKNDIKKNAVKSKAIKNGQVKAADIADGAVGSAQIADGGVAQVDLGAPEASHRVGAAGEPQFSNGGGDCLWGSATYPADVGLPSPNPVSFFKDLSGVVHLSGVMVANDGGPDGCGGADPLSDIVAFTMPAGYIPQNNEAIISGTDGGGATVVVVLGTAGLNEPGISLPPGAVLPFGGVADGDVHILDGFTYRAAGPGTAGIDTRSSGAEAEDLLKSLR